MRYAALALISAAAACKGGETTCGTGTHQENGTCVLTLSCGSGTHQNGSFCVPDSTGGGATTCGHGTHLSGTTCVPDSTPATLTCAAGTHQAGASCVADSVCASGSHVDNGECVPDVVCGSGTHASLGECVPDASGGPTWDVRLLSQDVTADGYSKIPVRVIGRNADGTPATGAVVLDTTLSGAGTFSATSFTVPTMGRDLFFTPCSSTAAGCSGVFQITAALASAPNTPIASSWPLTLQAPAGVGSDTPCLAGGNVLFFDGDTGDYIHPGTATITNATWQPTASSTDVRLWVTPSDSQQGLWWDLEFSSAQLGQPLAQQVYQDAQRAPFASPGHPGIDIGGDGRGCNTITGKFQIEDLQLNGSTLSSFTATFEQHCEGGTAALRGCVHYGQ